MKWFYKWFGKKINQSMNDDGIVETEHTGSNLISAKHPKPIRVREGSDDIASEPIQFKMYKANGGWAIEFRQYDRKYDKVDTSLYVFNDDQELGNSISKIITMEALKR